MKKLISMFITGAMLLTAFPTVSAAVQTNPGYTTEQPAVKTDADSLPTLDVGDESAFKGYTLSNVSAGERENADSLADKTGSASVGAGISFSVKGDTLTITGSGSMQGLMDNREYPWSDKASGVKHIVIQNGITDIYSYAFMNFKSLESISVPSSVTSIGEAAFYKCYSLKEIVLPSSVKKIDSGAFYYCSGIQKAQISGVTEIDDYAFQSAGLSTITLGKDLKQVSAMAFFGSRLTDIEVDSANTSLKAINGVLYNKAMDTLIFYPPRKAGKTFQVPASVKTIGSCAFCKNLYLESVDLSAAVTLKKSAFQECYALDSIVIPDSVTSAEDYTFDRCPDLETVILPETVTRIGEMFNYDYESHTKLLIPESVVSIADEGSFTEKRQSILGYEDSYAQRFAAEHDIPFEAVTKGDLNFDGKVTIEDATQMQKSLAEFSGVPSAENSAVIKLADVNGDGKFSIRDVTETQRKLAEL